MSKKTQKSSEVVHLRLQMPIYRKVMKIAASENRTITNHIRNLIQKDLAGRPATA